MGLVLSYVKSSALTLVLLFAICNLSDCYDPLDPGGNITITFDIHEWTSDGYVARVTIQNFYLYRHVDQPGWKLGWGWTRDEFIWSITGAFATEQGDCLPYKMPIHSCQKNPVIADLMPDALPANRTDGCCRGGRLSSWAIDPSNSFSSFEMKVGNLEANTAGYEPTNLTLLAPGPGYTCGPVLKADPTISLDNGGRRQNQVYKTWKSTCTYSRFLANKTPVCCVSLSTFYNSKVTACPKCSCGCREADQSTVPCIREDYPALKTTLNNPDMVRCTDHMCPVRVHWHIKNNYMDYWRVKLTVSNYNFNRSYSDWNVLVQHPGFKQKATSYSFNQTVLPTVGFADEAVLFWGVKNYNEELVHVELVQVDEKRLGAVMTEILFEKDRDTFSFRGGWGFPRRIYFSGEECQMPLPDTFPVLPNHSPTTRPLHLLLLLLLIYLTSKTLFTLL